VGLGLLVAAAISALALAMPAAEAAKSKKKGGNKTVTASTGNVNIPIPDGTMAAPGVLNVPITTGKALKGKEIADVDVRIRLTGVDVGSYNAALIAPNGATAGLVFPGLTTGTTWGTGPASCAGTPLTFSDESPNMLSQAPADQPDTLVEPYAGTAQPAGSAFAGNPLAVMDGGKPKGTFTVRIIDFSIGDTGTLHCAQVLIKPRKPLK